MHLRSKKTTENTIELSLFLMGSFIFVKCSNNAYMQFSNARLFSSDGSGHLNELNPNNSVNITHLTGKSVESLLLCLELNK